MSLEQAITDHAAAIRELAAAILGRASAAHVTGMLPIVEAQYGEAGYDHAKAAQEADKEIAAKVAAKEKADEQAKQKAELEKSVTKVEAAAKNAASAAGTATAAADTQTTAGAADTATAEAQTSYDYTKDVAPVLTKVAQESRDKLVALLASFGAKKGNELKPEQYAAVLAAAKPIIGG